MNQPGGALLLDLDISLGVASGSSFHGPILPRLILQALIASQHLSVRLHYIVPYSLLLYTNTAITARRAFQNCARMRPIMGAPTFKTGQQIPDSGVYKVIHQQHRLPHEVTLLKGETFPRCAKCGDRVEFELVHAAPYNRDGTAFQVQLYALPDLDDEGPVNPLSLGLAR